MLTWAVNTNMGALGVGCDRKVAEMSDYIWGEVAVYWNPIASKGAVRLYGILGHWFPVGL